MTVDQTATVGPGTRWSATYGGDNGYPDLAANDAKGFTYTTEALDQPIEVIGHPVVHLWVESSAGDADFFAYLEEVDPQGRSTYVTEGALRASHRRLGQAPFRNYGLPWPRSFDRDRSPLPSGGPTELVFDLHPTAQRFQKGNRIRLTITNADRDTHRQPYPAAAPLVSIHRGPIRASRIVLPMAKP
jgi:putative CocE/NonD family hydrolase